MDAKLIERLVCNKFRITPTKLREKTREREVVIPRQIYYYFCGIKTKLILHETAIAYDGLDVRQNHATVLHSRKGVSSALETRDRLIAPYVYSIIESLKRIKIEKFKTVRLKHLRPYEIKIKCKRCNFIAQL